MKIRCFRPRRSRGRKHGTCSFEVGLYFFVCFRISVCVCFRTFPYLEIMPSDRRVWENHHHNSGWFRAARASEIVISKLSAAASPRPKAWMAHFPSPFCYLKLCFAFSVGLFFVKFCYLETFPNEVIVWGVAHHNFGHRSFKDL